MDFPCATTRRRRVFYRLPSRGEFRFQSNNEDASFWHGFAATGYYSGTIVDIFKPTSTNPEIQLAYTSFGVTSGYYLSRIRLLRVRLSNTQLGSPGDGKRQLQRAHRGATLDQ